MNYKEKFEGKLRPHIIPCDTKYQGRVFKSRDGVTRYKVDHRGSLRKLPLE